MAARGRGAISDVFMVFLNTSGVYRTFWSKTVILFSDKPTKWVGLVGKIAMLRVAGFRIGRLVGDLRLFFGSWVETDSVWWSSLAFGGFDEDSCGADLPCNIYHYINGCDAETWWDAIGGTQ